ncbi:hypothetical protein [Arthrobacter sp. NPDC056727]
MTYATPAQCVVAIGSARSVENVPLNADRETDCRPVAVLLEETL